MTLDNNFSSYPSANLDAVLNFLQFTLNFQAIERTIHISGRNHPENDAEHAYQLTLLAWYMNQSYNLGFDTNKLIRMTLVHDLVETYAGDTAVFGNQDYKDSKQEREEAALTRIKAEFPDFHDLHHEIESYERRESEESKFIYVLDKLIPMLNLYIEGNGWWRKNNVSFARLHEEKMPKTHFYPSLKPLFETLFERLAQHPEWFAPND